MNVTLEDASEVYVKSGKESRFLGEFLRVMRLGAAPQNRQR